jgi:cytidylate kinase
LSFASLYVKEIVTLSGDIGGGKSSVARILKETLGFQLISAGGIQREIAASMGLTTLQLNEWSAKDRSVDDKIDSHTKWLGETSDHIIVDSRLAWHFIPTAYKVFLSVDPAVGAERVFEASRSDEFHGSLAEALENNLARARLEAVRYRTLYGIELRDYRNYDLVVDTSFTSPQQVASLIETGFRARNAGQPFAHAWMCPQRLARLPRAPGDAQPDAADGVVTLAVRDGQFVLVSGEAAIASAVRDEISLIPARFAFSASTA